MFSDRYDAHAVESQVQADWQSRDVYRVTEHNPKYPRGKYYACSMLPYPSGKLHMGHVRNYTINDVMARQLRMAGFNVLMPMGWDAFGLPAENAAMANKLAPARWTWDNIASMKAQMQAMGLAIDWSREVATCSPDYYRWNQWLFLQMLRQGIAYLKTGTVNWDPVDQTVLANEQVIDGRGWRSGALVEKREIPMYYLRITRYAEELIQDLDPLGWPERVKVMQRNWIGKSVGLRFAFPHQIEDTKGQWVQDGKLYVFTTRADTIMGVTFVAVAPEHPLATEAARRRPALQAFIDDCLQGGVAEADLASREKDGRDTGLSVSHPITGEPIPVWIGNYVLMSYGDGAVMGVPAHDERDFAFAQRFSLPIKQVIAIDGEHFDEKQWQSWYENKQQGHCINSDRYTGLNHENAIDAIAADLESRGLGTRQIQYRLRDWGISRQRYWGTPIPVIHCEDCGVVPVPESDLPVVLPEDLIPDGSGNPLNKYHPFLICPCPQCAKPARRETDTMDTFIDSAWYYMRYCSPDASESMVDARNDYWMPMDQYIGGIEHAVLHLLYARFWTKVMRDLNFGAPGGRGLVTCSEPFSNLLTQGMVLNETFFREDEAGRKTWFNPADVEVSFDERGRPIGALSRHDQQAVQLGGVEKMSKSKNNGVDPQHLIDRYGADTARLFTMFASPPEQSLEWSDAGVEGAHRFLRRVWASCMQALQKQQIQPALTVADPALNTASADLRRDMHQLLKQADFDYQRRQYNTVVSACMKMLNTLEAAPGTVSAAVRSEGFSILLRVLYPVVPHIAVALWKAMGFEALAGDLLDAPWPEVDERALMKQTVSLVLQINGKLRGNLELPADASHPVIEASARQWIEEHDALARFAPGQAIRKLIVVPGRLVNAVTG
jgi:leucyl-tRNA synthetase